MRQHVFATTSRKRRQKRYARNSPFRAVLASSGGLTTTLTSGFDFYYSAPDRGAEYCDERVCLSVCLSVCVCICPRSCRWNYTSYLHQFLCMLPMAVARSSSGGVVIRYVFPGFMDDVIFAHNGPITIAIRARFEYDSNKIRLRFGYNTLQHATRFFVRSHTRSYTRISGRRVLHVD